MNFRSKEVERQLDEQKIKIAAMESERREMERKLNMQREREEHTEKEIVVLRGNIKFHSNFQCGVPQAVTWPLQCSSVTTVAVLRLKVQICL